MDPLPAINKIFSMVIQYERQFAPVNIGSDLDDSKVLVNASDTRRSQGRGKGSYGNGYGSKKRVCTYCGKDNHIVDNYYKKHGFPPSYGRNNSTNNVNTEDSAPVNNEDIGNTKDNESFGLTKAQHEKLVNLLQTTAIPSTSAQVNGASTSGTAGIKIIDVGKIECIRVFMRKILIEIHIE
ncbi:unnamed protein product [Trifolium pratense]|uniref:Uncharacterized protein n=1 Tax=Trifolium pratense TaxID=57577 RepID=A0ACB0JN12_TRIPR|nr:unnamed protein product [Trifolium pratense]